MYISRNIDLKLKLWSTNQPRCPLILRGGRQVGKSASVTELGKSFPSFVVADFERTPKLSEIFAGELDPRHLVSQIEVILDQRITPGKTLLFLDEIQECPRAIASLRYFKEQMPDLHVIAAGSLLEFALGDFSFPVGRVNYEFLYPLTFAEFLRATNRSILAEKIPQYKPNGPLPQVDEMAATKLYQSLKEYWIVGGMPEAVLSYIQSNSFLAAQQVHDKLIMGFRDDIPKYASGELLKRNVTQILSRLANHVGEQVTYTKLLEDDPKRNKNSVFLLEKAMLIHLSHATSPASLPLGVNADEKSIKPVFIDIALMRRLCGCSIQQINDMNDLVAGFRGQLAEQFIGQELIASGLGSENRQLYYWKRQAKSSTAEIDYLISRGGNVIPVEVKSGASGSMRSMHLILKTYANLNLGICLQNTKTCIQMEKIVFLPLFTQFDE